MVDVLPKEKKFAVIREAQEDVKSQEAQEKGEKGIWDSVKEFAGDVWDNVKDVAGTVIMDTAASVLKSIFRKWF